MGSHVMRRPPKYVHGFVDHDGKARFYFRRAGFKTVALPGLPWSPEFMSAYDEARTAQGIAIGASGTKPGTLKALAVAYYNSKLSIAAPKYVKDQQIRNMNFKKRGLPQGKRQPQ
jgi:hypothetical protein